ncbi:hypothetical protein ACFLU3_03575 [Chloroflexota bacterium]
MPIEYQLEKNGAVVVASATGVLSLDCFMSMQNALRADTDLNDPYNTLLDTRCVERIELTEDDLVTIAKSLTSEPKKLGADKLAIVAEDEQVFRLVSKYGAIDKGVLSKVITFVHEDVARGWLDID